MSSDDEPRPQQNTPFWMDVPAREPTPRTGVTPQRNSGLSTLAFFAAIVIAVGAAGFAGIAIWGPEKQVASRSHLATDPLPSTSLPSLPSSLTDPPPAPSAAESVAAAPADSAPPPAGKKGKRGPRAGKKSH